MQHSKQARFGAATFRSILLVSIPLAGCTVGDMDAQRIENLGDGVEVGVLPIMGQGVKAAFVREVRDDGSEVAWIGDMEVPLEPDWAQAVVAPNDAVIRSILATTNRNHLWPDAVIPFAIDGALPNPDRVSGAIADIEAKTKLRFVSYNPLMHSSFVYITKDGARDGFCTSMLGRQVARATVIRLDDGCRTQEIVHEFGHAIGLKHTHQRPDRDEHIVVERGSISERDWNVNFRKIEGYWISPGADYADEWYEPFRPIGEYRTDSVMHYGSYWPGAGVVLRRRDGSLIARHGMLTNGDAVAIDEMYANPPAPEPPPGNGGY